MDHPQRDVWICPACGDEVPGRDVIDAIGIPIPEMWGEGLLVLGMDQTVHMCWWLGWVMTPVMKHMLMGAAVRLLADSPLKPPVGWLGHLATQPTNPEMLGMPSGR